MYCKTENQELAIASGPASILNQPAQAIAHEICLFSPISCAVAATKKRARYSQWSVERHVQQECMCSLSPLQRDGTGQ